MVVVVVGGTEWGWNGMITNDDWRQEETDKNREKESKGEGREGADAKRKKSLRFLFLSFFLAPKRNFERF